MQTINETRPYFDPEKKQHKDFKEYAELARKLGLVTLGSNTGFAGSMFNPELTANQLANAAMLQLFDASQLAPGDMKNKVLAFQEEVKTILVHYIKEAMRTEQHRIGVTLEASGHSAAASLIKLGV